MPRGPLAVLLAGALAEAAVKALVLAWPGSPEQPCDARCTDLPGLIVAAPDGGRITAGQTTITLTPAGCTVDTADQRLIQALARICR